MPHVTNPLAMQVDSEWWKHRMGADDVNARLDGSAILSCGRKFARGLQDEMVDIMSKNADVAGAIDYCVNPHACPGEALYARFADSLHNALHKTYYIVFHGTREENIQSILKDGLDPSKRRSGAFDSFGANLKTCLPYCTWKRDGDERKILIFAVLLDPSQEEYLCTQDGVVVSSDAAFQLPIGHVCFKQDIMQSRNYLQYTAERSVCQFITTLPGHDITTKYMVFNHLYETNILFDALAQHDPTLYGDSPMQHIQVNRVLHDLAARVRHCCKIESHRLRINSALVLTITSPSNRCWLAQCVEDANMEVSGELAELIHTVTSLLASSSTAA